MKVERKVFRREVLHYEEVEYHCCGQAMELIKTLWSSPPQHEAKCSICRNIGYVPHDENRFVLGPREEVIDDPTDASE